MSGSGGWTEPSAGELLSVRLKKLVDAGEELGRWATEWPSAVEELFGGAEEDAPVRGLAALRAGMDGLSASRPDGAPLDGTVASRTSMVFAVLADLGDDDLAALARFTGLARDDREVLEGFAALSAADRRTFAAFAALTPASRNALLARTEHRDIRRRVAAAVGARPPS